MSVGGKSLGNYPDPRSTEPRSTSYSATEVCDATLVDKSDAWGPFAGCRSADECVLTTLHAQGGRGPHLFIWRWSLTLPPAERNTPVVGSNSVPVRWCRGPFLPYRFEE
jgi:hypothetical protein